MLNSQENLHKNGTKNHEGARKYLLQMRGVISKSVCSTRDDWGSTSLDMKRLMINCFQVLLQARQEMLIQLA